MSTELAVASGISIAEAIGMTGGETKTSVGMPRMSIIHQPIMGTMDVNGKKVKTEVIPAGAFKYTPNSDTTIYSVNPEIRVFAFRQQWSKWDNEQEKMLKTVLANDLKGDLKDNNGGFNLGRPSGYVQDFNSLPQETKDIMRTVKRTKVVFGVAKFADATDENGEPVSGYDMEQPFSIDLKNTPSIKAFDTAMTVLSRKNMLPIQHSLVLGADEHQIPTGAKYYSPSFAAGTAVDISEGDQDTLNNFMEFIEYVNARILDDWAENNSDHGMSADDVDLVHQFVDVDEAD